MSPTRPSLPRPLLALIRTFITCDRADALVDDREEELARRLSAPGPPPRWPRLWLTSRVIADSAALAWSSLALAGRSQRHIVRDAWRSLRSTPGTSLFALLILTVGMAGATVTFSVVDAVVLRPFPFESRGLVELSGQVPEPFANRIVSAMEFAAWRDGVPALESLAAYNDNADILTTGSGTILIPSARVTANLFDVLQVHPLLGHAFSIEDEQPGRDRVIVIGYEVWQWLFGGDPNVIGRRIPFRAGPATVVGVMPPGFTFPAVPTLETVEAWSPYVVPANERPGNGVVRYLKTVGRLRRGATREQAAAQMSASTAEFRATHPYAFRDWRPVVVPLEDAWLGQARSWMLLILAAVAVMMTIACANVANLLLIRTASRGRELGIRTALGATRRQLIATLLVESLLLSFAASLAGLAISIAGVRLARAGLPAGILRASMIAIDVRVLLAVVAAAVCTGVGFGVVPAWHASQADVSALIKDGTSTSTARRGRWRTVFLVTEIATVGVLLVVTTLFVSSFIRIVRTDLGFDRNNLLAVSQLSGFSGDPGDVVRALEHTPGIRSAAAVKSTPPLMTVAFQGGSSGTRIRRPDRPDLGELHADFDEVSGAYFGTAAIPILRGRTYADDGTAATELILDATAARALFPDRDPVGATVLLADKPRTVVGVAAGVLMDGPGRPPRPQVYIPLEAQQWPELIVRTSQPAATMVTAVGATVGQFVAADTRVRVTLIEDAFRKITADRRFNAGVLGIFGLVALLIGAAGVYSVMASDVAQREREFAVRVALGATRSRLRRALLAYTAHHVAAGLAIGLPAAWWASRTFASLLFEVKTTDVTPYLIVAVVIATIGALAAIVPARRAGQVDPTATLKS